MSKERREQRECRGTAFTLIELLATVAIIGLLVALLFPALQNIGLKAKQAACANNLKQIGVGFALYVTDHDNTYPLAMDLSVNSDQRSFWSYALWPYVGYGYGSFNYPENDLQGTTGLDKNIFHCPVTKHQPLSRMAEIRMPGATAAAGNKCSYAMNNSPSYVIFGSAKIAFKANPIGSPGKTALVLEQDENPGNQYVFNGYYGLLPHEKHCNVLYFDGHIDILGEKEIPPTRDFTDSRLAPFWSGR